MFDIKKPICIFLALLLALSAAGCSSGGGSDAPSGNEHNTADSQDKSGERRETHTEFLTPDPSGEVVYGDETASIDASNVSDGYVCVYYGGDSDNAKAQIVDPNGEKYIYNLVNGEKNIFPFSDGDGKYEVSVLEHIEDSSYAVLLSQEIDVKLKDEFTPFLYPNQYVQFKKGDDVTELGIELSEESSDDLDYLTQVYNYVINNISYDVEFAEEVTTIYIPDLSNTLKTKKGICFDYASLMAALLRSQGIPTKLVFGYSGTLYHAWISVYTEETGWLDNVIYFDGHKWYLLDPTLAANNRESFTRDYISNGDNYTEKFKY